jgi:hypothetical protein
VTRAEMNCPKCNADIGNSYEPDDRSGGIRGGWYCDACELAIGEQEVPREPVAGDVEFRGDWPLETPLSELSTQPRPADDLGRPDLDTTSAAMCPNQISMEVLMPPHSVSADGATAEPSGVVLPAVTPHEPSETDFTWNNRMKRADLLAEAPRRPRHYLAPVLLTTAAADPQTDAAIKLVAWISRGMMRPASEDFAMVRLALLALLPQIGGMLLLICRRQQRRPEGAAR